jgi:protein SCO1
MRVAPALTLVTLATLMLVQVHDAPQQTLQQQPLPKIAPAPEFSLTSQDGGQVTLSDFRGKVVAVTFIYTLCTSTCPVLTPTWGEPHGSAPPTPPYIRVRIRRFERLR